MDVIFECEICGNVFSNMFAKNRHQKTAKYCSPDVKYEYACICKYKTPIKSSFIRHIQTCISKQMVTELTDKMQNQIEELELEKEVLSVKLEVANKLNDLYAAKLKTLKVDLFEHQLKAANSAGQITVYEKHPKTVVNGNYNNAKLMNVKCDTIRPFTIETIREEIGKGAFTYELFVKGAQGVAELIEAMTTHDDQRSYLCTDAARNKFHRLLESREWKDDNGASFLHTLFDELVVPANEYYDRILAQINGAGLTHEQKDKADALKLQSRPLFFAITEKNSAHRGDILNKVRAEVKKNSSI